MKYSIPGAAAVVDISQRLAATCSQLAKDKFGSKVPWKSLFPPGGGVDTEAPLCCPGVVHPVDLRGATVHLGFAHALASDPS